jgi:hypothetical protein
VTKGIVAGGNWFPEITKKMVDSHNTGSELEAHEPVIAASLGLMATIIAAVAKFFRGKPPPPVATLSSLAAQFDEHAVVDKEAQANIEESLRGLKQDLKEGLEQMEERVVGSLEHIHDRLVTLERKSNGGE